MPELRKREVAHKLRIGDILNGNPIIEQETTEQGIARERFKFLELNSKQIQRVNIVANVIDKFISEGEKRFATLTVDDASGQIRLKVFGEDTVKFNELNQGDTIIIIGLLRSYKEELYLLPEIIKKVDPRYLLVRKLELENSQPVKQTPESKAQSQGLKDQIINLIKAGEEQGGVDTDQLIIKLKESTPDQINNEIKKLLEEGIIYEPRPGRVRYLG